MTRLVHNCRIVAYEPWGTPATPVFSRNLTSDRFYEAAEKREGGVINLYRERDRNLDRDARKDYEATSAIRLTHTLAYPNNARTDWADAYAGSMDYVSEETSVDNGNQCLFFGLTDNSKIPGGTFGIRATSAFIEQNLAFSLHLRLFPATLASPSGYKYVQLLVLAFDDWFFRIYDGEPYMMRQSKDYAANSNLEVDLQALEQKIGKSDADQQQIDAWRKLLFVDYKKLDLGIEKREWYGKNNYSATITFIPEPRGIINVIAEGRKADQIKHSDVANTRQPGIIWRTNQPTLSHNGGMFIWQFGYPVFANEGSLTGESYDYATWALSSGPTWGGLFDCGTATPNVGSINSNFVADPYLPGTEIVFDNPAVSPAPPLGNSRQLKVTLKSNDTRHTPFLYTLQAFIPAGDRSGSAGRIIWDSAAHADQGGNPIIDVRPVHEDDQKTVCRRRGCDVETRDIYGALNLAGAGFGSYVGDWDMLENCQADVYIDGYLIISEALIRVATQQDVADSGGTQKMSTRVKLELHDMWNIAEDDTMYDDPIGDGMLVSDYLILLLRGMGATAADYAGITPGQGPILPQAALGEKPCIRPEPGMKRADMLRKIVERYGDGWVLTCLNGRWTFGPRNSSAGIDPIGTAVSGTTQYWAFSGAGINNKQNTFPGRYAILETFDLPTDTTDFYNWFVVEGKSLPNGDPLVDQLRIPYSVDLAHRDDIRFIGRWKQYPKVKDDSLRTKGDLWTVLRSLAANHGRSVQYGCFKTYLHPALSAGTVITADGIEGIVTRISDASALNDEMQVTYMEI